MVKIIKTSISDNKNYKIVIITPFLRLFGFFLRKIQTVEY